MMSRSLPRSMQISETLIREITSGLIADGSRLPAERTMASSYGVAVGTLRKALAVLEEKGLLERRQGSGNYVRRKASVSSIYSQFRLELLEGGGLPTAQILDTKQEETPPQALSFGFSASSFRIDRIRFLNDVPIALERIWLDGSYNAHSKVEDINESLYKFYKDHLGLIISRIEDSLSVAFFPDWGCLASLQAGEPVGYIERRAWSQSERAAEFSQTWFNAEKTRYINRIEHN